MDVFENQDFSDTFTVHVENADGTAPIDAAPGYDERRASAQALSRSLKAANDTIQPKPAALNRTGSLDARLSREKAELDEASQYHLQRRGHTELVTGASFRAELSNFGGDEELRKSLGAPRKRG